MKMKRKFSRGIQKFLRSLPKNLKSHHNYSSLSVCIQNFQKSCYRNIILTSVCLISSNFRAKDCHFAELLGPWDYVWMCMIKITILETMKNPIHWKCRQTDYTLHTAFALKECFTSWLYSGHGETPCNFLATSAVLSDVVGQFMLHSCNEGRLEMQPAVHQAGL